MSSRIWQSSHPLPSPAAGPPQPSAPAAAPRPPSPPAVWAAPVDHQVFDHPAASLPNLPALPNLRPTLPPPQDSVLPSTVDSDKLLQRFLGFGIADQPHSLTNDHLHRSASPHNPFAPPSASPVNHHLLRPPSRLPPASAPVDLHNDLHQDDPLHFLTSSTSVLSLQPSGSAAHSIYTSVTDGGVSDLHVGPPRGSPILRPSSVPASSPALAPPLALGALPPLQGPPAPRIKNELYKTEICRSYAESGGYCKYGAKCQFAHGSAELRPVRRHPRYKTKLCRNFVSNGSCPYDARCRFIHANDLSYAQAPGATPPAQQSSIPASQMNPTSAGSLAHHTQLRVGHALLGASQPHHEQQQHGINMQDNYPDNLRFLNLESSLSLNPAANHLDQYADVDIINADRRSAASPHGDLQTDKPIHSVLPTDQVYNANASVFQNYPENAFYNTFMSISGGDNDRRYPASSDLSDQDPVHTAQPFTKPVSNSAVGENDSSGLILSRFPGPQRESLFSNPATSNRTISPPGSAKKGTIGSRIGSGNDTVVEGDTHVAPASSPLSRSRLPVLQNIATDDEAP